MTRKMLCLALCCCLMAALLPASAEGLSVSAATWEISGNGQSVFIDRPSISGAAEVTIAYNLYDSEGRAVNYFYSDEARVAVTPGYEGLFNVFIVVTDTATGAQNTQNIGWQGLQGPGGGTATQPPQATAAPTPAPTALRPLSVGDVAFEVSADRQHIYIDRPAVSGGSGSVLIAYNIYDAEGNAVNYFYSDESRVAATPGYAGRFNVFVVVTDTVTGEQHTQNVGWNDLVGPEGDDNQPPAPPEGDDSQPPAPPEGDDNQPPAPPEGDDNQPPAPPEGDDNQPPTPPEGDDNQPPTPPNDDNNNNNDNTDSQAAAFTLTEDSAGGVYASQTGSEVAVLVKGSAVTMTDATVTKSGSGAGENADFYGTNAAVLAKGGATLTVDGGTVTTSGAYANGIFSYGSGTTVNVKGTAITTGSNNSGGLMTTGGGTMNAENVTVSTSGGSSAAIRSDRGGGTVKVTGGDFRTSGVGSPAIYSTAAISVSGATLSASASEAVVIEGGNSVSLSNVSITGCNSRLNGQSTQKTNVLIYQSMSGDASEGASTFTMKGGSMTCKTGSMFHVTNVTTTISLSNVAFTPASDSDVFLSATADSWGTSGKNGGHVTLNLSNQAVSGVIEADSVSSVSVSLAGNSTWTGAVTGSGAVKVTIEEGSTWTLTADCAIASFTGDMSSVNTNGYTLTVGE